MDNFSLFVAVVAIFAATDVVQGTLYDMQEGIPQWIVTPCGTGNRLGAWIEDAAANYQMTEGGKVVVSQKNMESCMRAPAQVIQQDYILTIRIFVSREGYNPGRKDVLVVRVVEEGNSIVHDVDINQDLFVIGWQTVTFNLPSLSFGAKAYFAEVASVNTGQAYTAIRWFSFGSEGLSPTTTSIATELTTWEYPLTDIETTTTVEDTTVDPETTSWTNPSTVNATQPTEATTMVEEETTRDSSDFPTTPTPLTSTTTDAITTRRVGCRSSWHRKKN